MIARTFKVACDEPVELCGENTAANPQELLMSALNACMMVGYVAGCAVRGIALEQLELETSGELDLRGFLGIDESCLGFHGVNQRFLDCHGIITFAFMFAFP